MSCYGTIRTYDTADGVGIRTAVYFSGCQKALEGNPCPGCHNSVAWNQDYGNEWTSEILQKVVDSLREDYVAGLSVLGGEPFSDFNIPEVLILITTVKNTYPEKDVWVWTGYTIEELLQKSIQNPIIIDMLKHVDILVDGPYLQDLKEPNLIFRGSKNQKILKIQPTTDAISYEDITNHFMY